MKPVFNTKAGGALRYFICPDDSFVLNTFELLSREEYLYRILRHEGYRRVYMLLPSDDVRDLNTNRLFAYDKLSELSFKNIKLFNETYDPDAPASIDDFYNKCGTNNAGSAKPSPLQALQSNSSMPAAVNKSNDSEAKEYGLRSVKNNITTFTQLFGELESNIITIMTSDNVKTAFVISVDSLKQILLSIHQKESNAYEREIEAIAGFIRKVNTRPKNKNKIIFMSDNTDFFSDEHIGRIFSNTKSYNTEDTKKLISDLKSARIAVITDKINSDEIANLIFRQKYICKDERFKKIPDTMVYVLADKLKSYLLGEKKEFDSLEDVNRDDPVNLLEAYFEEEKLVNELTGYCEKHPSSIPLNENIEKSIYTDRITGNRTVYYKVDPFEELDELIGLNAVKDRVRALMSLVKYSTSGKPEPGHYIFAGNPGTGKTEVARLMGRILFKIGALSKGHVVEVSKEGLESEHVGGTAPKTLDKCKEALGGVLLVDEAYRLYSESESDFGRQSLETIMKFMEDNRNDLTVIFTGYKDKLAKLYEINPGLKSRISKEVEFPDYTADELVEIMKLMAKKENLKMTDEFVAVSREKFEAWTKKKREGFGNARVVRSYLKEANTRRAERLAKMEKNGEKIDKAIFDLIIEEDAEETKNEVTDPFRELNKLIGLNSVKKQVKGISNRIKYAKGHVVPGHYIFLGNPGTGKSEVARLMGRILHNIGALSVGHVVEVSKEGLEAGYVGQTSLKTKEKCEEALGGVLLVDEAYRLYEEAGLDYGKQSIETIMKFMEDNRDDLTVIFTGYENKFEAVYKMNPGIRSRFRNEITFPDYTADELVEIMKLMVKGEDLGLNMTEGFVNSSKEIFKEWLQNKKEDFGNAREVRKYLENADQNRSDRLAEIEESGGTLSEDEKYILTEDDIPEKDPGTVNAISNNGGGFEYKKVDRVKFENMPVPEKFENYNKDIEDEERTDLIGDSILFIYTDNGTGTAFLISPDGYALTCNHVIQDKKVIKAKCTINEKGYWYDFKVVNAKEDIDIALIKIESVDMMRTSPKDISDAYTLAEDKKFPYLPLAKKDRVIKTAEKYMLAGHPFGYEDFSINTGMINSGIKVDGAVVEYYTVQGEAKSGNSGSPILAYKDGRVIGILPGSITNENGKLVEEINIIRPIKYFWEEFLK